MERYNSLRSFLQKKFGEKVYKVSLFSGLTCPNRDGTKGTGGCIYCNPASNKPLVMGGDSIREQLRLGIGYVKKRHKGSAKFISYFQHYSNTYSAPDDLRKMYDDAISDPEVVGLAISTRPDCLNEGLWDILRDLNNRTLLWLELGLQSANDRTLSIIERGHTTKEFEDAAKTAERYGIMTCAHIILGLPGETRNDIMRTVQLLVDLNVDGIKIHNLHILKGTKIADLYKEGKVPLLTRNEYASLVTDCLERLPRRVVIHRFSGHSPRDLTIAPEWSVNKLGTLNAVHEELQRRDTWQGRLLGEARPD